MDDVKVTQRHREIACQALGISDDLHARKWVASGDDDNNWTEDMRDVAHELAKAEHRVRAAVIADLRGLLERAQYHDEPEMRDLKWVDAHSIELLIETYEAAQ